MENNNLVFVGLPLDAVIASGLTSHSAVEVTAADGVILIERYVEGNCDCICNECRAELAESEAAEC